MGRQKGGEQTRMRGTGSVCAKVSQQMEERPASQPAQGRTTASRFLKSRKPFLTAGNRGPGLPEPSPNTEIAKHSPEATE